MADKKTGENPSPNTRTPQKSSESRRESPLGPKWAWALAAVVAGFLLLSVINKTAPTPSAPPVAPLAPDAQPVRRALPTDAWVGTWTGVEGLRLDIAKHSGGYALHIVTMDGAGDYFGRPAGDGIVFERSGKQEKIVAGDGKATGLKWLADKTNCLIIQPGEGFCRPEGNP